MHKRQATLYIDGAVDNIKSARTFKSAKVQIDRLLADGVADIEYFHTLRVLASELCPDCNVKIAKSKRDYCLDIYTYLAAKFENITHFEVCADSAEELELLDTICRAVIMDTSHALNVLNGTNEEWNYTKAERAADIILSLKAAAVEVLCKYTVKGAEQSIKAWKNDIAGMVSNKNQQRKSA